MLALWEHSHLHWVVVHSLFDVLAVIRIAREPDFVAQLAELKRRVFDALSLSTKRSCIHFVTAKGQIIPFDTYNQFYRMRTHHRLREPAPAAE